MAGPDRFREQIAAVKSEFTRAFPDVRGVGVVRAPGRVELLGGHVEAEDGLVLSAAVRPCVVVAYARSRDGRLRVRCEGEPPAEFDPPIRNGAASVPGKGGIVRAVAAGLAGRGIEPPGLCLVAQGDIPAGAGLGESAALATAAALALLQVAGKELPRLELARLCRAAINEPTAGIAEALTAPAGRRGRCLLLDCRTLECESPPLNSGEAVLVLADTGVRRDQSFDALVIRRREECREAVRLLSRFDRSITHLRDARRELLEDHYGDLSRAAAGRARHVIEETRRAGEARAALRAGQLSRFGRLLTESHASLRDDYELSCRELDGVVRLAGTLPGVLGARMVAGGPFGAAAVLVEASAADGVAAAISAEHFREFSRRPTIVKTDAADGAEVVEESRPG